MSSVSDQQWLRQIGVDLDADAEHDDDALEDRDSTSADESADEDPDDESPGSDNAVGPVSDDHTADDSSDLFVDAGDDHITSAEGESPRAHVDLDQETQQRTRRYTPWVLGAFAAVVVLATVITTLGVTLSGPDNAARSPHEHHDKSSIAPTLAAAPAPPPAEGGDHPLPFAASADCPAGASTSAKSIADPDNPTPWICVRHTDGQPLYITLGPAGIEHAYVITAVSIVPGDTAAAKGSGGDPWLQHRVVTLLQWQFNDTAHTVVDQDTGNVHGEAVKPIPGINASKITVIIRQTSRPVAAPPPSASAPDGGPFGGILGGPTTATGPQPTSGPDPSGFGSGHDTDPSDGTFAVSSIKIIGHKAT